MAVGSLSLTEVPLKKNGRYAFDRSSEFPASWWKMEYADGAEAHCLSARRDDIEVARLKLQLYERSPFESVFGPMPDGNLDILAFEVAKSVRGAGIGRATLLALRTKYPRPRFTALNDDDVSRGFWDSIGWIRHESPDPFLAMTERANYSEV